MVLFGLYTLDILDLYGKVAWIGQSDSFSFKVVRERSFAAEPLPRPAFLGFNSTSVEVGAEALRTSGWTSFYDRCGELYATADESNPFDLVKAIDCDLRAPFSSAPVHDVPELVLSATLRADSVAWVSCQLVFFHRRPPICQENIVTQFSQRYQWPEKEVDHDQMAPINSMAEAELLKMLDFLSRSYPLVDAVCVQGFQSIAGPGHYTATLFACASPNIVESVFVGTYATTFAGLHENLTGLAVDKLNIMGFELVSRQNSRALFRLREKNGEVIVEEQNLVNFFTSGHLYVAMIITDSLLLVAHSRAAVDTSRIVGWSSFRGVDDTVYGDSTWLLMYRSLYRSGCIVFLTILSGIISWFVGLPFALMWCSNAEGKTYAVLSAIRVWVLVVCLLNIMWGVFVRVRESRAYNVVKCTFITPLEVLVVSGLAVTFETTRLFGVADVRRRLEGQQTIDSDAFPGRIAVSNAYNENVDGFATTSPHMLLLLLSPLLIVIAEIIALVVLVLLLKSMYYRHQLLLQEREAASSVAVVDFDNIDQHLDDPTPEHTSSTVPLLIRGQAKLYHRLPLEELLRTPARANSLVRCCFDVDVVEDDGLTYMLPHVYHEFGVVVSDAGFLRARWGFSSVIHRRLDVESFFAPTDGSSSVSPSPLKRQRIGDGHAAGRAKFALNSVPSPTDAIVTAQGSPSPPRTRSEFRSTAMSRSMRRRKSMENLLDNSSPKF
ncbi:unnamed protein product [Phytophthora fragariaefolia]|uniref:Unnamed protein product n=1 Tax=Phytophthora fragariaefolia TaxID=1490495 RepID=A0A9W6XVH6_9STRA|nr:unnamed protein product [Phytophthora fragariaefolia]